MEYYCCQLMIVVMMTIMLGSVIGQQGMLYQMNPSSFSIATVNPQTGMLKSVGPSQWPKGLEAIRGSSAFDISRGVYYAGAYQSASKQTVLLGFDVLTGKLLSTINLPFIVEESVLLESDAIPALDYDSVTDSLIVLGILAANQTQLIQVSLSNNNTITVLNEKITSIQTSYQGSSCFDSDHQVEWLIGFSTETGLNTLFGYSTVTGKLLTQVGNNQLIQTMQYDINSKSIVAIGQNQLIPTLVSVSTSSGEAIIKEYLPQYNFVNLDQSSAFDQATSSFFTFQTPDNSSTFYQLSTINVINGQVVDQPLACSQYALCAISLEFWN